jgi:2-polyprenyl-3-methyl-5-hydroxy-6-metoxy-1,4-benzoquinol methylase
MVNKNYWDKVYAARAATSVSWYQEHADCSLSLLRNTGITRSASIIDVGGGASTLVDDLLAEGYSDVTVLDLSAAALSAARQRLGALAAKVQWLQADVTVADLPSHRYDVWHDRAVFHFLTEPQQRQAYVEKVFHSVKPGGMLLLPTLPRMDRPSAAVCRRCAMQPANFTRSLVKHSLWSVISKKLITLRREMCSSSFIVIAAWLVRERSRHITLLTKQAKLRIFRRSRIC